MKLSQAKPTLIAVSIGLLLACAANAQDKATDADKARELAAARADLDRAAKRVAELSREQGGAETFVFERRFESRPVLGVVLAPDSSAGVRIAAVTPESAAAKAGLRSGDRITAIDGKKLNDESSDLRLVQAREKLRSIDTQTPVALTYERDGRSTTVKATPQPGDRVLLVRDQDGGPLVTRHIVTGSGAADSDMDGEAIGVHVAPLVAPQVRSEIIRLGPPGNCKGDDCRLPMLTDAFRWSGFNLATVDKDLGRYFGTDRGVLVLSNSTELAGLKAGDVIQSIDGKAVDSPREAMAALRQKPADSQATVTYLRDRKTATAQVKVPKPTRFEFPVPPAPPAPPAPPTPAARVAPPPPPPAAPAPVAPPAPPAAPPAPPAPPKPPQAPALSMVL